MTTTFTARIHVLSKLLMAIASTQTSDVCEAHLLTHTALVRILGKDPGLAHFAQVMETLGAEIDAREALRHAAAKAA